VKLNNTQEKGSEWYILSRSWFTKWQSYVYYDKVIEDAGEKDTKDVSRDHPGPIDNQDIILPKEDLSQIYTYLNAKDMFISCHLKPDVKEG